MLKELEKTIRSRDIDFFNLLERDGGLRSLVDRLSPEWGRSDQTQKVKDLVRLAKMGIAPSKIRAAVADWLAKHERELWSPVAAQLHTTETMIRLFDQMVTDHAFPIDG